MNNGIINIADADVGFTLNGTTYTFENCDSVTIEDPKRNHLIRGVSSTSKFGLSYQEGTASPYVITTTLKSIGIEYESLLKKAFEDKTRIDFWVIERKTGTNKTFKEAIVGNAPKQLNIGEGEDSLDIEFVVEGFSYESNYK